MKAGFSALTLVGARVALLPLWRGRLPGWKLEHGWAAEVSPQPENSREPVEDLVLIPYGCAKLRVTEFPRLAG